MLLLDISLDWDSENPWSLSDSIKAIDSEGNITRVTEQEIRKGHGFPIVTDVDLSLVYLGSKVQTKDSVIFG